MSLMKTSRKLGTKLTSQEINNGIIIDFEGVGVATTGAEQGLLKPPSLLGTRCDRKTTFYLLDKKLALLGRGVRDHHERACRVATLRAALAEIAHKAHQENRFVIAFSRHESDLIERFSSAEMVSAFSDILADIKPVFEKGFKRKKGRAPRRTEGERTLACMASLWRRPLVECQRDIEVGMTIRKLRRALVGKSRLRSVTPEVRERFRDLLEYNHMDLRITHEAGRAAAKLIES